MDNNHSPNHTQDDSGQDPELSALEQEILDEYAKLAGNLDNVRPHPTTLSDMHTIFGLTPSIALRHLGGASVQTFSRNSGRAARAREVDNDGVYAAEGERVFDCAPTRDLWRG